MAIGVTPSPQAAWEPGVYMDKKSGVFGVERLPVGIIQGRRSVEFRVVTVSEPGAKTLARGRMRVTAEKRTIVRLKERARNKVLYSWLRRSIRYIVFISILGLH